MIIVSEKPIVLPFSHYKSMGKKIRAQRRIPPKWIIWCRPNWNSFKLLCLSLLPASLTIKGDWEKLETSFFSPLRARNSFWFRRRRFFKGFYHIWAWRPSWSCDQDRLNKLSFPHPMETPYEIWLQSAQWFLRRCLECGQQMEAYLSYKLTNEPLAQVS